MALLTAGEIAILVVQCVQMLLAFLLHYNCTFKSNCCRGGWVWEESITAHGQEVEDHSKVVRPSTPLAGSKKTSPRIIPKLVV